VLIAECEGKMRASVEWTSNSGNGQANIPSKEDIVVMLQKKQLSPEVVEMINKGELSRTDIEKLIQENGLKIDAKDLEQMIKSVSFAKEVTTDYFVNKELIPKPQGQDEGGPSKDDLIAMLEEKSGIKMTGADVMQFRQFSEEQLLQMIAAYSKKKPARRPNV